ncbi:MAG: TolC family protein [Rickettsiales bacterium]|nr:TolC family protein [Rickettsiales bacterium]
MFKCNYWHQKLVLKVILLMHVIILSACSVKLEPLTETEIEEIINHDAKLIDDNRVWLSENKPISLYDAMAIALVNNLDFRVKYLEEVVSRGQFDISKYEMLPELNVNAGTGHRNPERASSSESVTTRNQSLEPSTSEDRSRAYSDATFSWNLIDFGVSYYQARQDANRVLIAQELKRKALHDILVEVRETYWRAAAAQDLKEQIDEVIVRLNVAIRKAEQIERSQLRPPLETLRFKRSLISIMREMKDMKDYLQKAEFDLYKLLNMPLDREYKLEYQEIDMSQIPVVNLDREELLREALISRPEMREEIYKHKISYDETKKAFLRLFPGIELQLSQSYDSNSFLVDKFWHEISAQVTSNLMDVLSYKSRMENAKAVENVAVKKRMALQLAILSQVHISFSDYNTALEKLEHYKEVSDVDERISILTDISAQNEAEMELERIKAKASAITAKLQEFRSYANFQNSFGRLLYSIGYDVVEIEGDYESIESLSKDFEMQLSSLKENDRMFAFLGWEDSNVY